MTKPGPKPWNPSPRQLKLIQLNYYKISMIALAESLHVSCKLLRRFLKREGIYKPFITADQPRIISDYISGLSLREVGARHGLTHTAVYRILRKHKIACRHPKKNWYGSHPNNATHTQAAQKITETP